MAPTIRASGRRVPIIPSAQTVVLMSAINLFAQGVQTGTIRGTVVDQQDLPLPGVTVSISSSALQGQRAATTAQDGTYAFRALPAGDYQIEFDISSFASLTRAASVPLGASIVQNVTMAPAGVSEVVDVVGSASSPYDTGGRLQHQARRGRGARDVAHAAGDRDAVARPDRQLAPMPARW